MRGLTTLDGGLPPFAGLLVAALGGTVLAASGAVALNRASDTPRRRGTTPATHAPGSRPPTGGPDGGPSGGGIPVDYLVDVTAVLPAFQHVPDALAGTGAVGLADAARFNNGGRPATAQQQRAMRDLGYAGGQSRAWDDGVRTVVAYAYEWRTENGARAFLRGVVALHAGRRDAWRPHATGSAGGCYREGKDVVDTAVVQVGRHTFTLAVIRTGSCGEHAVADMIATAQHDRAVALHA